MGAYDFLLHFTPDQGQSIESQTRTLKKACREFESLFWEYLLKGMRKTVPKGGILGNRWEEEIYTSMYDEELSVRMSESAGLGLADSLFNQLEPSLNAHRAEPSEESSEDRTHEENETRKKP